jgi:hypothetical protein
MYMCEEMGSVLGAGSKGMLTTLAGLGGDGSSGAVQCRHDTIVDCTGLGIHASNNHPSKPFAHLHSIYFPTVIGIKNTCLFKNKS